MPWDNTKATNEAQPSVPDTEQITAMEWNNHVSDQKNHSARHESGGIDEISVAGLLGVLSDDQPSGVLDSGTSKGSATTLDFTSNLSATISGGVADISAAEAGGTDDNTVYASNNLGHLPTIQDGLNALSDGSKQHLHIVGGVNEITQTIDLPNFGSGVGTTMQAVGVTTAPDSVIRQANGAELSILVDARGVISELDVAIEGNKGNNTTAVTGVIVNEQSYSQATVRAKSCDVGLRVTGNTESNLYRCYVEQCDTGVLVDSDGTSTPDENTFLVNGHANDGPFFHVTGGVIKSTLIAGVESTSSGPAALFESGTTFATGEFRGAATYGLELNGGSVKASNVFCGSMGEYGIFVHGGSDKSVFNGVEVQCGGAAGTGGIRLGDAAESNRAKHIVVNGMEVGSPDQYGVNFDYTHACAVQDGIEFIDGSTSGYGIRMNDAAEDRLRWHGPIHANYSSIEFTGAESKPSIIYSGGMSGADVGAITNPHIGMTVEFNHDDGLPNYYDGTGWVLPDGTSATTA